MNGALRQGGLLLGAGAAGIGLIATGNGAPSKKQAVVWGMSSELDKANSKVERRREEGLGFVSLSVDEIERAQELAFGYVAYKKLDVKLINKS